MNQLARVSDSTAHGSPLQPGPGSANVLVGDLPAWRALPAGGVAAALDGLSAQMDSLMSSRMLTPADAGAQLGSIAGLAQQAGAAAAAGDPATKLAGDPAATGAVSSATAALASANAALSTAYASASAAPGGQPAATQAYTEGIKAATASAASAVVQAVAGSADVHMCPTPCPGPLHGPGVVTRGCATVFVNDLPAVRQGDEVVEAAGGSDPIASGCATVFIGD